MCVCGKGRKCSLRCWKLIIIELGSRNDSFLHRTSEQEEAMNVTCGCCLVVSRTISSWVLVLCFILGIVSGGAKPFHRWKGGIFSPMAEQGQTLAGEGACIECRVSEIWHRALRSSRARRFRGGAGRGRARSAKELHAEDRARHVLADISSSELWSTGLTLRIALTSDVFGLFATRPFRDGVDTVYPRLYRNFSGFFFPKRAPRGIR